MDEDHKLGVRCFENLPVFIVSLLERSVINYWGLEIITGSKLEVKGRPRKIKFYEEKPKDPQKEDGDYVSSLESHEVG